MIHRYKMHIAYEIDGDGISNYLLALADVQAEDEAQAEGLVYKYIGENLYYDCDRVHRVVSCEEIPLIEPDDDEEGVLDVALGYQFNPDYFDEWDWGEPDTKGIDESSFTSAYTYDWICGNYKSRNLYDYITF